MEATIHIGPVEGAYIYDTDDTYSDGTPFGLVVSSQPVSPNHAVRLADLGDASVNPLADEACVLVGSIGDFINGRVVTAGTGINLSDGGPGGSLTISTVQDIGTTATPSFAGVRVDGVQVIGQQQSAIVSLTDNTGGTASDALNALPDPADMPLTADVLRDDLVANLIPQLRNDFASLGARVNSILNVLRTHGLIAT